MSDQSFIAKLDNMKNYKVLTVADLVSILAGQPPMMEVYLYPEDQESNYFINGIETLNGCMFIHGGLYPKIYKDGPVRSVEEQLAEKRNAAMNMQRQSELASRMPEVVE